MLAAGRGRIINIGAESVRNGLFNHAMYNCAKGGVHGLTTGLAREYAEQGVTVNVVAPAGILTPTIAQRTGPEWEEMLAKTLALIPMRRLGLPEEIAAAVSFLATDDAAYITGQVISVNGGSSML
jgi:2,3-dihydroxy-2,3-dihydro-p-cumate dehydrogenase